MPISFGVLSVASDNYQQPRGNPPYKCNRQKWVHFIVYTIISKSTYYYSLRYDKVSPEEDEVVRELTVVPAEVPEVDFVPSSAPSLLSDIIPTKFLSDFPCLFLKFLSML